MKILRYLSAFLVFGFIGATFAQNPNPNLPKLIISPRAAELQPGEGIHFEAALFTPSGNAVRIQSIRWSVEPDTLGQITDDGFFIAGRHPSAGVVVATVGAAGFDSPFTARAAVSIGRHAQPRLRVMIHPALPVVPPGESLQFRASVVNDAGEMVEVKNIRWEVSPRNIGKISPDGLFEAGRREEQGVVAAFVETDFGVFHGREKLTVAPRPAAAISGSVVDDETGLPVTSGKVAAERIGRIEWGQAARIDSNGQYLLDRLIPGLYVVKAASRGYLVAYYDGADHFTEATPVQAAADDTVGGIDFRLVRGGSISGAITTDEDQQPIAGAHVFAILAVKPNVKFHALSQDDGAYTIENLPSGTYAVFAEAEGYKGEFFEDGNSLLDADLITVEQPESVAGIDFGLATASAIAGRVVDAITGDPISRAKVLIYSLLAPRPHPHALKAVQTNENGEYIASVKSGFYLVAADARGYHFELYDGTRERNEATPVQVFADQHSTGIDFELDPLGSISGRVIDETTGAPIAGAIVTAFPERPKHDGMRDPSDLRSAFAARTDSNGVYAIDHLRAGEYFVLAEARGFLHEFWQDSDRIGDATPVVVAESENVTDIDFTLEQGGEISGVVLDAESGNPPRHAVVLVKRVGGDIVARSQTRDDGSYLIAGLRSGDYLVRAEAKGFTPQFYDGAETEDEATPVTVQAPDETAGIDFQLTRQRRGRGSISGTVVSESDGNPIPFALIVAIPGSGGKPAVGFTNRLGEYQLGGMKTDRYVLFACAPRFICEFYQNARNFHDATPVAVTAGAETAGIDFSLEPRQRGAYLIAGRVTKGNSQHGAANAIVYAMENGSSVASAMTDNDGNYSLDELPAGEYKLQATGATGTAFFGGQDENSATPVAVGSGQNASSISMSLPEVSTGVNDDAATPTVYALEQNYPNPFNPETTIEYQLPSQATVELKIYNGLGQEVRTLVDKVQEAGVHTIRWDGRDDLGRELSTGIYLYRIEAGEFSFTRKMAYLK